MNFFLPLASALSSAAGLTLSKINFRCTRISVRTLMLCELSIMVLVVAAYAAPFSTLSFTKSIEGLSVLLAITGLSFVQNVCEAKGLQLLNMNVRQPIAGLEPLLTAGLAYSIFPSKRRIRTLLAVVLGVFIVRWASAESVPAYGVRALGNRYAALDAALSASIDVLLKIGTTLYSPVVVPLVRISGVLVLSLIFFRPLREQPSTNQLALGALAGFAFGIAAITTALSVRQFGLNLTILILLLQPCIVYLLSYKTLGERIRWRPIVASAGVALLVAVTV